MVIDAFLERIAVAAYAKAYRFSTVNALGRSSIRSLVGPENLAN
jgi:hypothetical protein